MKNTIYITTPCLNAVETIDRTIMSVVTQAGDFRIRYHVQDGGSRDGTWERLLHWRDTLRNPPFPIACAGITFTCAQERDTGMYDALARGFGSMEIPSSSFMTWINADDVLFMGAFAYISAFERQFTREQVSWVSGLVALIKDDRLISCFDIPRPWAALKAGLCDGHHWPFHQQEGTFFRRWLWEAIDPERNIRPMKLAGDWNLWRLFAQHANLVQSNYPMGAFRVRQDQLSGKHRDKYMAEIEALVPTAERARELQALVAGGTVVRSRAAGKYPETTIYLYEEDITSQARTQYEKVFGSPPAEKPLPYRQQRLLLTGAQAEPAPDGGAPSPKLRLRWAHRSVIAEDGWQFPAVTERHSAQQVERLVRLPSGTFYVGLPWATIIDKLQSGAADRWEWLEALYELSRKIPAGVRRVTVCQHILMKRHLELFRLCGITDVFWSHATREDVSRAGKDEFTIHPFPLYPVNTPPALPPDARRRYLFSFVGAKPNAHYLTEVRQWILDRLSGEPDGHVIGRQEWHFQRIVYDRQILGDPGSEAAAQPASAGDAASVEFSTVLSDSVFSLCPSGSGPNSIRLWESLGSGAIPVVLADEWAPPGPAALWDAAVVWCRETPEAVAALPEALRRIASDPARLASMREACRQLWLLYGPETFVTDLQHWALRGACAATSAESVAVRSASRLPGLAASRLLSAEGASAEAAQLFGRALSSSMLLADMASAKEMAEDPSFVAARSKMTEILGSEHPTVALAERVTGFAMRRRSSPSRGGRPMRRESRIRVCLMGKHAHRTPLAYDVYREATRDAVDYVVSPADADVVVTGFGIDVEALASKLVPAIDARPELRVLVVSEEPLWDTVWSRPVTDRHRSVDCREGRIDYTVLNHFNSSIFKFERIPYFVTTSDDFLVRYRALMAAESKVPAQVRLERWAKAATRVAFFAERRNGNEFSPAVDVPDVCGLSRFRTLVAELSDGPRTLRVGQGWGTPVRRQQLPDWHLAKLAALKGDVFMVSALENTHHRDYITEKPFDAVAVGALPIVFASRESRLGDLLPAEACLNVHGLSPEVAAARIAETLPTRERASAVGGAAERLSELFGDHDVIAAERARVARAVVDEIERILHGERPVAKA